VVVEVVWVAGDWGVGWGVGWEVAVVEVERGMVGALGVVRAAAVAVTCYHLHRHITSDVSYSCHMPSVVQILATTGTPHQMSDSQRLIPCRLRTHHPGADKTIHKQPPCMLCLAM
jgi:hypothetical protein